jgi:hypothetical protein
VEDRQWKITVEIPKGFSADLVIHVHAPDGQPLRATSLGLIRGDKIMIAKSLTAEATTFHLLVS